ncbi:L7Ae/L30e/S12e/Gadd45 family ribosomal protein [Tindallia californiensis]|uniref:Ribosomal protein L7Ae n=1 Tax=Tindallia californiensis TaxID=159292 RepID=A0A1H3NP02_9FIRM|nr:L7Ae/L30e/S12e/Gadd45 family ribosomal protein [Tindallia californiensis]SDY90632.1 Ribosomal protein L7Ae [Tindallia californiensis]
MNEHKMITMLGFASKSRNIVSGETGCRIALEKKKAKLLIIAEDATNGTKVLFERISAQQGIPYIFFGTKVELGRAIGKSARSTIVINDDGMADSITRMVKYEPQSK